MPDDDSPEAWMATSRLRNALRLLGVGLAALVGGAIWAGAYWNSGVGASPISYVRVVSVLVIAIGGGMTIAGAVLLARRTMG